MKINQNIINNQSEILAKITGAELQALAKELTAFETLFEYDNGNAYVTTTAAAAFALGYEQGLLESRENINDKTTTPKHIEECWHIYKNDLQRNNPDISNEAITNTYQSLMSTLFQGKHEVAQFETSTRYQSPFTNKWFSSVRNLLKAEIPYLITSEDKRLKREQEQHGRRLKDNELLKLAKQRHEKC